MCITCLQAKELDALDEVFGIGELIEEDMKSRKKYAYTAKDLKGLKVEHSSVSLSNHIILIIPHCSFKTTSICNLSG